MIARHAPWIAMLLLMATPTQAQEPPPTPDEIARYQAVWKAAEQDAELTFGALPSIEDKRTHNMVLRYNMAARGWWVGMRCKFGTPEEKSQFQENLRQFTNVMDGVLAMDFHKTLREGNTYSQNIQMYALNAMSAKKFYDCSDNAEDVWLAGQDDAERAARAFRKARDDIEKRKTQQNK